MDAPEVRPRQVVPAKRLNTDYPVRSPAPAASPMDRNPLTIHFKRVIGYARPSDYAVGAATTVAGPAAMLLMERVAPSYVGRGGFPPIMRLTAGVGLVAGFLMVYQRSIYRFYGVTENRREIDMDMKEMVGKIKQGQSLYGESSLTEHIQGVSSRNSRYSAVFQHVMPWFNFVNHNQHGVDTAKYYQQAERELAAEGK
ncbi:uncharacterized protein K452DRAFT_349450 [Aplosporella prunicola CBS 121167]|uniref:NADH-ubiquinone oxidoreductase 21kDa subunit N-terminal domain-containing protein n=1 Tax=Aplosporella prunicola CBS 121167 TaxID=1176127 RepID=A0A6A6BQT4_9PEZI|nr:uncharacterized protein K452DRAFT_349450 [Aplosporella prunicola CBS 121167]KAF2145167.1 hypothetical protein K452DRAFT_349450 [Aplosporella prunicola CBS 121167]